MAERNMVNITITMTPKERKAIRQAALDNDCSISELIRQWLAQYWAKQKGVEKNG